MSLAGRNRTRGMRYDVWRATETDAAGGLKALDWNPMQHDARGVVDTITQELAQRVFGREVTCEFRLWIADPGADIKHDDAVVFQSGLLAGRTFRVSGVFIETGSRHAAHLEAALVETRESIP